MKRVVVFGGAGFLGSHVVEELCRRGFFVRIYDSDNFGYHLSGSYEVIKGDVLDEERVKKAVEGCDIVYNYAGVSDIERASERPLHTVRSNILGNTVILEACRLYRVQRFVFASSLYVYSQKGSFYRGTKHACELLIENYHECFNLPYTILRYGSLYGPRADERNIIFKFITQALTEGKITREGNGEEIREYIHVTDAARLSVQILDESYANRHLVLTGQERMAVKNLMRMISEMLPGGVNVRYGNRHDDGHYAMTPYAFHPKVGHKLVANDYVDLGQGLLDCLADIHERLGIPGRKRTDGRKRPAGSRPKR